MNFKEKAPTVEAFQMTEEAYRDQESWPEWVKNAWGLEPRDVGSFHCLHNDPDQMRITNREGTGRISFGTYLISPEWTACTRGLDRVMSKEAFERKYEEA